MTQPPSARDLTDSERQILLDQLAQIVSDADVQAPARTFVPLPFHANALRDQYTVLRGEKGTGKTALFRFVTWLQQQSGPRAVLEMFPGAELASDSHWIDAFSEFGSTHPSVMAMDQFGASASLEDLRLFWSAYLVVRCAAIDGVGSALDLSSLSEPARSDPKQLVAWAKERAAALTSWLDGLERRLSAQGQTVYFAYDHLDRIGLGNPKTRKQYAGALLGLWMSLSDRYRRLRAKIFIREDLFEEGQSAVTDVTKLKNRSIQFRWDDESLYRVLVRHMAAQGPELRAWIESALQPTNPERTEPFQLTLFPSSVLPDPERELLGYMPPYPFLPAQQKKLIDCLTDEVIGRGAAKGPTWKWILSRIHDARDQRAPRPLLNLIRFAAEHAKERQSATGRRLLDTDDLLAALVPTSKQRMDELKSEYRYVWRLEHLRGTTMRLPKKEFVQRLSLPWPDQEDGMGSQGERVYEELVRLGVLQSFQDWSVDVPDLYRYALEIKRVGRPKTPK